MKDSQSIEVGNNYAIHHARKGLFTLHITKVSEEWVTGTIIKGSIKVLQEENKKYEGEEVTLRKSLIIKADLCKEEDS